MLRTLAQIAFVISLSAPKLPSVQVNQFAEVIQTQAEKNDIEALMFVAIIQHESLFNERALSKDGQDFGLMQIRSSHFGGNNNANNARLLIGIENIKVGAYSIKLNKEFCEHWLGRTPETEEWLACYTGSCKATRNFCKPTKLTKQFSDYEKCLEKEVDTGMSEDCGKIYYGKVK